MIASIASGKGGTGKTTLAVNLALALGKDAQYIDCDVEEPNGHLFMKPEIDQKLSGQVLVPRFDQDKCTYCGLCESRCPNGLPVVDIIKRAQQTMYRKA